MRGLILAVQFLTRLPTPQLKTFRPEWLREAARWFGAVGLVVGALVYAAVLAGQRIDPWAAALAGISVWVWVTGALHLDGLADLSDALGAAHRDRERFLQVIKDPHLGSFGTLALIMAVLGKTVLLMLLAQSARLSPGIVLIPAWARLFAVFWSACLPALAPGSGERFAWGTDWRAFGVSMLVLALLSAWLAPVLCLAPLAGLAWWCFLKRRLGGMTGDCLGAGIEVSELALLVALLLAGRLG
ncbi:adenosylcobinamide-GDP ribazoletransferase [Paludibacterium yongneupense]|uniref:adenosylcobinamide-GDP ribazoletransferase n=1 Tax=Paludibacterium yongneupense TaxID=400061 RepID=UPI000425CEBB|nr:adenosylcobinamide-GDP ribazoletransferase [Paludibacterium yongneupense]